MVPPEVTLLRNLFMTSTADQQSNLHQNEFRVVVPTSRDMIKLLYFCGFSSKGATVIDHDLHFCTIEAYSTNIEIVRVSNNASTTKCDILANNIEVHEGQVG